MGNSSSSRASGDSHRSESSVHRKEHSWRGLKLGTLKVSLHEPPEEQPEPDPEPELENDLNVSFGYHCRTYSRDGDEPLAKSFGESSSSHLGGSTPGSFGDISPLTGLPCPGGGDGWKRSKKHGSFSSLAGAALGANTTLCNTTLAHGTVPNLDSPRNFRKLGSGILSGSSFATSTHSSSSSSGGSNPFAFKTTSSPSPPLPSILDDGWPRNGGGPHSSSAPSLAKHSSFLHASDLQMAGGCAGEDRVMAVCSEENGWLFCGVYDGFNGRDAADYLAGNLYENVCLQLRLLEWRLQQDQSGAEAPLVGGRIWQHTCSEHSLLGSRKDSSDDMADVLASVDSNASGLDLEKKGGKKGGREAPMSIPPAGPSHVRRATSPKAIRGLPRIVEGKRRSLSPWSRSGSSMSRSLSETSFPRSPKRAALPPRCEACVAAEHLRAQGGPAGSVATGGSSGGVSKEELFQSGVVRGLTRALAQTESDFMDSVEAEMDERPDLVMVGSCVLAILMHGQHLYALNLGDSRAVLATQGGRVGVGEAERCCEDGCVAVQLTQDHKVADVDERDRLIGEHPDDDTTVWNGRVKGKLAVTRAFGAGYLKKTKMNDALMGILRVSDLESPPYISTQPWVSVHEVSPADRFVILSSDGLNDFFTNEEAVHEVCRFSQDHPEGDPAKHLLEELLTRAAEKSGMTVEQLKSVPSGRRRKYHDDITIVIIMLQPGSMKTSSASTLNGHV